MIFNLIVGNTDNHVKSHGMLHVSGGQYRLAPAFDIVMQLSNMGFRELAITSAKSSKQSCARNNGRRQQSHPKIIH